MNKISVDEIVSKVQELDSLLKGSGWKRDNRIEFAFDNDNYRVELSVFEKDEDEEGDNE